MRYCALFLIVVAVVHPAAAGQNPDLRLYLDFDPPTCTTTIEPAPESFFNVYVVFDHFGPGGGIRGFSLALERAFGGYAAARGSVPPGASVGYVEDPYAGWACATFDCQYPDATGTVVMGYVTYYYTGPPGTLRVLRTQLDQGEAYDCDIEADYYCIGGHAGVWTEAPCGEPECLLGPTPVGLGSWGAVKALYR